MQISFSLAAATYARKKSSQKSTRPRGAKDAVTFPGAIGRNNACVRADSLAGALGGRKRCLRVGECIVADGRLPCQRQPLRGQPVPSQGVDPSTWFVDLRGDGLNRSIKVRFAKMPQSEKSFLIRTTTCLSPSIHARHLPMHLLSSWAGKIREPAATGQAEFLTNIKNKRISVPAADATPSCCRNFFLT